jgi:hypothetical protein
MNLTPYTETTLALDEQEDLLLENSHGSDAPWTEASHSLLYATSVPSRYRTEDHTFGTLGSLPEAAEARFEVLRSEHFVVPKEGVHSDEGRRLLAGCSEVLQLMEKENLTFDEARLMLVMHKMNAAAGVAEDGMPLDPKAFTFGASPGRSATTTACYSSHTDPLLPSLPGTTHGQSSNRCRNCLRGLHARRGG